MSLDITIWQWKEGAEETDESEVWAAIQGDDPHPALSRFNAHGLADFLRDEFELADDADALLILDVCDFKGWPSNWIHVSIAYSQVEWVMPRIRRIASERRLHIYGDT